MKRPSIVAGAAFAALALVASAVALRHRAAERPGASPRSSASRAPGPARPAPPPPRDDSPGFLHGRVTTVAGAAHEGRLRFGGDQEAFWDDVFNGKKIGNAWAAQVPAGRLPKERRPIELFGIEVAGREREADPTRLFAARLGDLTRIEASGREVRVTLKSGTVHVLDRLEASDLDDGVRVWDPGRGPVDLDSSLVRTIELLPAPALPFAAERLRGTVRTRQGGFSGLVEWDREKGAVSDVLRGRAGADEVALRLDALRSVARRSRDSCLVTLHDGRELVLSGSRDAGEGNRGIAVDDARRGRVVVSWDAFERVDLGPAAGGPVYGDFPPGRPITGRVTVRGGRRLAGRLVYDLDESETTDLLDAPADGVDRSIPFGLIASIVPAAKAAGGSPSALVTLHGGEELRLEPRGDLGERNGGLLVFDGGSTPPEYVPWADVERIDLDRP